MGSFQLVVALKDSLIISRRGIAQLGSSTACSFLLFSCL